MAPSYNGYRACWLFDPAPLVRGGFSHTDTAYCHGVNGVYVLKLLNLPDSLKVFTERLSSFFKPPPLVRCDHLLPPDRHSDSRYRSMVGHIFIQGFDDRMVLCIVCLPSFATEWMSGIRVLNKGGRKNEAAFVLKARSRIWNVRYAEIAQTGRISYGKNGKTISVAEGLADHFPSGIPKIEDIIADCQEVAIDPKTSALIKQVWSVALAETAPPPPAEARLWYFDGTNYDFLQSGQRTIGRTCSPQAGSRMAALVLLGNCLAEYAASDHSNRDKRLFDLRRAANTFLRGGLSNQAHGMGKA